VHVVGQVRATEQCQYIGSVPYQHYVISILIVFGIEPRQEDAEETTKEECRECEERERELEEMKESHANETKEIKEHCQEKIEDVNSRWTKQIKEKDDQNELLKKEMDTIKRKLMEAQSSLEEYRSQTRKQQERTSCCSDSSSVAQAVSGIVG
jgi:predicted RNase H-like nuclease (RuvC/YqgF family)